MTTTAKPAPVLLRYVRQGSFETRVLLTNGEQLMVSLLLPIATLIGLTKFDVGGIIAEPRINYVAPSVIALAVIASAFTSQAIATGFDRRNGVLRLTATNPLGRSGWLAGKLISIFVVLVVQLVILCGVAYALGWRPEIPGIPFAAAAVVLGTVAFGSFGLWLGGRLRMEAVLALSNIIFIALATGGGVLVSVAQLTPGLQQVARYLPSGLLGEALRESLNNGSLPWWPLLGLAGWAILFAALVIRFFKWVSK